VSSPSFALINQYEGNIPINHIDLYRIKNEKELLNLGLDDLWDDASITFVEWPEIIESIIDWHHFRILIESNIKKRKWRKFKLYEYNE
jgi:tRNA threonylcarbamoyladenosine biosynthesis protein TsaE